MKRRSHGDGGIDERGPNTWRLRYRVKGRRHAVTFHGSLSDARKQLRALLKTGDDGTHIAPDKMTLAQWVDQWITTGAPGRRQKRVGRRALARYEELLRCHVVPTLGARPLQQLEAVEIDSLYVKLEGRIAPATARYVHDVLNACLGTALRKGLVAANPMSRAMKVPSAGESNHGMALDHDQLRVLVEGFKGSTLFPIVVLAAFTGARRNEILALQWSDFAADKKSLRIERAVENIHGQSPTLKGPKTERGKRTITIDDELIALLCAEREKHLRIMAGVPDGAAVDLALVRLPDAALMFPAMPEPGESFSFTKLRSPDSVTKQFIRRAHKLGFPRLRLHDLRGTHETLLLDSGVPLHVVASRCGHDPAVLLRSYAKRTKKADKSAAEAIGALSRGILGG